MAEEVSADVTPSLVEKPQIVDDPPPGMSRRTLLKVLAAQALPGVGSRVQAKTAVEIVADRFHINGKPTYAGRTWRGMRIEGLLMNSRMVQGIFDDLNPATRDMWVYPDTESWDPDRNTREFVAAMPEWRRHGLLAFTINLQGGSPQGYSQDQPWHNNAFTADGALRPTISAGSSRFSIAPTNSAWSSSSAASTSVRTSG